MKTEKYTNIYTNPGSPRFRRSGFFTASIYRRLTRISLVFFLAFLQPSAVFADFTGGNGGINAPTISLSGPSSASEGNSGTTTNVNFTVSINTCPAIAPITLVYHFDGITENSQYTAQKGTDFVAEPAANTVTFAATANCTKTKTITLKIKGDDTYENDETLGILLDNAGGNNPSQGFTVSPSSLTLTITNDDDPKVDMHITKRVNGGPNSNHNVGETVTYTLDLQNLSTLPASKMTVTDYFPDELNFVSVATNVTPASDFGCQYTSTTREIRCTGSKLFTNADRPKITITGTVNTAQPKGVTNTAHVDPVGYDELTPFNNTASVTIFINTVPSQYNFSKTVDKNSVDLNDTVTFTVQTNRTQGNLQEKLRIQDPLNGFGSSAGSFAYIPGTLQAITPNLDCAYKATSGPLAPSNGMQSFHNPIVCESKNNFEINTTYAFSFQARVTKVSTRNGCSYQNDTRNIAYFYRNAGSATSQIGSADVSLTVRRKTNQPPVLGPSAQSLNGTTLPTLQYGQSVTLVGGLTGSNASYFSDPDGDPLEINISGLPQGLSYNTAVHNIGGQPVQNGTFHVTVTASDCDGASVSFTFDIEVKSFALSAKDNTYIEPTAGNTLTGNMITDVDSLNGKDIGTGQLRLVSHTNPAQGTLTVSPSNNGSFTYTLATPLSSDVNFTYTITDDSGDTSTATVTIAKVGSPGGGITNGHIFYIVNPQDTRNLLGNFVMTGNTVLCVSNKTGESNESNSFGGTCQNNQIANNNFYVARYIDIDNDSGTWNSSSAAFDLPGTSQEIVWAGLFWQGSVNNFANGYKQRRAIPNQNGTYSFLDINTSTDISIPDSGAKKILLKIDGSPYHQVEVSGPDDTFFYDKRHGNAGLKGGYYAAFSNVTDFVRDLNLSTGSHTATVANLISNEGREPNVGNYGGWSLVVIYKEDTSGTPHNISIFNGYDALTITHQEEQVQVSGFRLPKNGSVDAQFGAFIGEGEFLYGMDSNITDNMYIARTPSSPRSQVPATFPDNVFDASFDNIVRPSSPSTADNNISNTNGVDLDVYDVSDILEGYRDINVSTNSLTLGLSSKPDGTTNTTEIDYVTPSMLAFSVELYKPNLCYNYDLSIGTYILPSEENRIETNLGTYAGTLPLVTSVLIRSEESDFLLRDSNVTYHITNTGDVSYISGTTRIAEAGTTVYSDASSQTVNENQSGFTMYIGKDAAPGTGGTIDAFETRYFKFDDNMSNGDINTTFSLSLNFKINYGSGDLSLTKNFTEQDICSYSNDYILYKGSFNITNASASTAQTNFGKPFNLYTQVANRKFDAKLFSYIGTDYTDPNEINGSLEYDLFNADKYRGDVNASCLDPESNITASVAIRMNGESYKDINATIVSSAIRNTGFRIWYINDIYGHFYQHNCGAGDDLCFRGIYPDHYIDQNNSSKSDTLCNAVCTTNTTGCYACLRKYYASPVCSRDNFSIRPEAFVISVLDSNTSQSVNAQTIHIGDSVSIGQNGPDIPLVAGYPYRFDINATSYTDTRAVPGYIRVIDQNSLNRAIMVRWAPSGTVSNCNDTQSFNLSTVFINGLNIDSNGTTLQSISEVGRYEYNISDSNWTAVDWSLLSHHNSGNFTNGSDCSIGANTVLSEGTLTNANSLNGCLISSTHQHPSGSPIYVDLPMRFYPYTFTNNLSFTGGPGNTDVVYMNTLDPSNNYPIGYKDIGDKDMSYNIQGIFTAYSYNEGSVIGKRLGNFVSGCYADDVNMTLDYIVRTPENVQFRVNLTDKNSTGANIDMTQKYPWSHTTEPAADIGTATPNAQNTKSTYLAQHGSTFFVKDMNGSIDMDMGINIDRQFQTPMNPVKVTLREFNITDAVPLALTVKLQSNYQSKVQIPLNDRNITFAYARAKPERALYDDITTNSVVTPVSVEIYCNLGTVQCLNRLTPNIGGTSYLGNETNEFGWWLSKEHTNIGGRTTLLINNGQPGGFALPINNPAVQNIMPNGIGIANNITIFKDPAAAMPATVDIELSALPLAPPNPYTDRWLIYNPDYDPATMGVNFIPPSPFYRVRFIDASGWTGAGKTGHVVGDDINKKKTRRLEW